MGFCLFERILNFTDFPLPPPTLIRELDSGLAESVSTLIWAAPRLQSEVAELKIVSTTSFSDAVVFPVVTLVYICHFCLLGQVILYPSHAAFEKGFVKWFIEWNCS